MPLVINNKTKKRYPVTDQELNSIKSNPLLKNAFTFIVTREPEEVTKLKKKLPRGSKTN